jgi:hypothetical protein
MLRAILVCLCLGLSACSALPEVGNTEARVNASGVTPALLTAKELAALTAAVPEPRLTLTSAAAALQARGKNLRRR